MSNVTMAKRLELRDKYDKRILKHHEDVLYRIFQIIHQADATVEWTKIYKFSPVSPFVNISATAILAGDEDDESKHMEISLTVPYGMFDDGSTPYQIADAIRDLAVYKQVAEPPDIFSFLMSEDSTMEKVREIIPDYKTIEEMVKGSSTVLNPSNNYPDFLSGFDTEKLDDEQKTKYSFSVHPESGNR